MQAKIRDFARKGGCSLGGRALSNIIFSPTPMWQDWTNAILGLVIIGVAFLGLSGSASTWTLAIIGLLVAVIGFWGVSEQSKQQ